MWLNWTVRAEGGVIGFVEATVLPESQVEVAYFIGKPYWGRGFGTDAARTMLGFLAHCLPAATFWATVDTRNTRSVKLLMRLGFQVVTETDPQNVRLRWTRTIVEI